jgi:hypothetical protein
MARKTTKPRNRADLTGRNLAKTRRDIAALTGRVRALEGAVRILARMACRASCALNSKAKRS